MNADKQMAINSGPISRAYITSEIPSSGVEGVIELDSGQLGAVSTMLEVPEVRSFHFSYRLAPLSQKRFKLTGKLKAHVIQECVVTLEPIDAMIDEDLEIELWPLKEVEAAEKLAEEEGKTILIDGPEPITDNVIDVGQLAYELLASTLDPFPRIKDSQINWTDATNEEIHDQPNKPFAGLDQLLRKNNQGSDGS